jgi:hypothetical protein
MASIAFGARVVAGDVYREGISEISADDIASAHELGYVVKLLAIGKVIEGGLELRVHPAFVAEHSMLANVDGVFNAVQVEGDLIGRILFYGRGAGAGPTSSAVVADVIAKNHRAWLNAPGRGGRPHQDNEMRRVAPDYGDLEVPGYPAGGWTSTESGGYCLSGSSRTTLPRRDPRPSLPTPAAARPITVRGAFPNTGPVRRSGT